MAPVRQQFEQLLERAAKADIEEVSGSCEDMLAHLTACCVAAVDRTSTPSLFERERAAA